MSFFHPVLSCGHAPDGKERSGSWGPGLRHGMAGGEAQPGFGGIGPVNAEVDEFASHAGPQTKHEDSARDIWCLHLL